MGQIKAWGGLPQGGGGTGRNVPQAFPMADPALHPAADQQVGHNPGHVPTQRLN